MLLQVTKYGNERRFNIKDILVTHLSRLFEVEVLELVTLAAQKYQDAGGFPCYFVGCTLMVTK